MNTTTNKIKRAVIIFICIFCLSKTYASVNLSGFELKTSNTGNGFGVNICPAVDFKLGQGNISIGANFQTRKLNLSGLQLSYTYCVSENEWSTARLYFFGNAIYNHTAYLSKNTIERENWINPEAQVDYSSMKLSTIEFHGGFGLKINHSQRISTSYGIGTGVYRTLGHGDFFQKMYRDKNACTLSLNFSLAYKFSKK